jgi:hypothetical protein
LAGVTPMDSTAAAVMVSVVEPAMLPRVAVMVVVPALMAVTSPTLLATLLMDAAAALLDVHVTDVDRSSLVPLLYRPVAVNWCTRPSGMLAPGGPTSMEVSWVPPPGAVVIEIEVEEPWLLQAVSRAASNKVPAMAMRRREGTAKNRAVEGVECFMRPAMLSLSTGAECWLGWRVVHGKPCRGSHDWRTLLR